MQEPAKSRQSALILAGNLVSKLMSMAALIVVSRTMGSSTIGLIVGAYALVGLFRFVFDAGLPTAHIKRISEGIDPAACLGAFIRLKLIATAAGLGVVALAIPIYLALPDANSDRLFLPVVIIVLAVRCINSMAQVPHATFTGTGRIAKKQMVQLVQSASDCLFVLAVALFVRDIVWLAATHLASEIVAGIVAWRLFKGYSVEKPDREQIRWYLKFSLPLIGSTVTESIYAHVDRLMILSFISAAAVGYYHMAWRVVFFVLMVPQSVSTILMPAASRYLASNQQAESARIMIKAERYLSLVIAPLCAGMAIFAYETMSIFGPDFTAGAPVLSILAAVCFLYSINRPAATMLLSLGRPGTILRMTVVLVTMNIVFNCLLIPQAIFGVTVAGLGSVGAAMSTLFVSIVGWWVTKSIVQRATGARTSLLIAIPPLAAVACGLVARALASLFLPTAFSPVLFAMVGCAILLFLYLSTLFLLGQLRHSDITYVAAAIHPMKLLADIKEDLSDHRTSSSVSGEAVL